MQQFRVVNIKTGEVYEADEDGQIYVGDDSIIMLPSGELACIDDYQPAPCDEYLKPQRSAGSCKDKHGNQLWENDVLKYLLLANPCEALLEVVWARGGFWMRYIKSGNLYKPLCIADWQQLTRVGNTLTDKESK